MSCRKFVVCLALSVWSVPGSCAPEAPPAVVLKQAARPAGASVNLHLQAANAATIAQSLGAVLGGTVRFEGTPTATVTLDLQGVAPRAALDALAAALYGSWRTIYTMSAGGTTTASRHPVPLGRTVTASLDNVSARTALALIARGGGATVEMVGDLPQRVKLDLQEMPVERALDEIARQAGATWSVIYVLKAGTAPPTNSLQPNRSPATDPNGNRVPGAASNPTSNRGGTRGTGLQGALEGGPNEQRSFPMPFAGPPQAPPPPDPNAAKMLGEGMARVMQMPPAQRRAAVKDFASQIEQQFKQMQSLPGPRRTEQMASNATALSGRHAGLQWLDAGPAPGIPADRRGVQPLDAVDRSRTQPWPPPHFHTDPGWYPVASDEASAGSFGYSRSGSVSLHQGVSASSHPGARRSRSYP